jgi:hypothetical protein
MPELNPYSPPRARPEARGGRGISGPIRMALRAAAVIWGFSLLAGPARPAPNTAVQEGQLFAKAFGAILIVAAFFPFGESRKKSLDHEGSTEEL